MTQNKQYRQSNINMASRKTDFQSTIRKGPKSASLKRVMSIARKAAPTDPKQSTNPIKCVCKVLSYSPLWEKLLFTLGCTLAMINGCCWPLVNYLIARMANELSQILILQNTQTSCIGTISSESAESCQNLTNTTVHEKLSMPTSDEWNGKISRFTIMASGVTALLLVTGFFFHLLLNAISERIVMRLRKRFFQAMLRQNVAWFDARSQGELSNYIMRNMASIQTALGVKLGMLLLCVWEITCSLIISFYSGWKLTLVLACAYPLLIVIAHFSNQLQHKMNKTIRILHGDLSGFLQEIFSAIKTVMAFGGEQKEYIRFLYRLRETRKANMRQTVISGMNFSIIFLITQCFTALGFWYGMHLMISTDTDGSENYTVRDVLVINVLVLVSGSFIRMAVPLIEVVANGFSAAIDIVAVLERKPDIDSSSDSGVTLQQLQGNIEFCNVHFCYPTSVGEKRILRGLNLKISAGETVALVGPSGGGKSTIMQMIQRFYDPQKGKVKIDSKNLQEFNLGWFRRKIGIVSQEPALFNITVRDNIRYGNEDATDEDIIRAAKEAHAHEFIMRLPEQYDTEVGEQGGQLSGGERQRIALARALVRNPTILLLDEATSALDNESEVMVQSSLDRARSGRTVIVIAHRLSTIRNADRIVSIRCGKVVEQGTHEQLLQNKNGVYYQFLQSQTGEKTQPVADDEEEEYTDDESQLDYAEDDDDDDDSDLDELLMYEPLDTDEEKKERSRIKKAFWKMLLLSKHDWMYIGISLSLSVVCALYHPARAYVFSNISNMTVLKSFSESNKLVLYPCLYAVVGFIAFVAFSLRGWSFSRSEENLLFRLRQRAFENMLRQEIGWFDDPRNTLANLVSLATVEAENVKYIPGTFLGTWIYAAVANILLFSMSLYFNWKLALAVGSISVFVFVTQYVHQRIIKGGLFNIHTTEEKANNLGLETIRNIRTVIALHIEENITQLYSNAVGHLRRIFDPQLMLRASIATLSDGLNMIGFIVALAYGSYLMYEREIDFFTYNVIQSFLIVNIMEVAQMLAVCPNYNKSCMSAYRLSRIIKRKPLIDSDPAAGLRLTDKVETKIVFRNVRFAYPTRPSEEILQGLNMAIEEGQTVAFVGKSGCGKSTAFQLLQRFYDPGEGSVALSGYDLRCLNIPSLRSLIGVVSQQPTLFNRTIAENIAYGDNSRTVCMHEIVDAARQANIHEFITSLRQGYETRLGQKGVQLSGGQKQRVAIARALVRNPRILLLDEATSALDNESEKIVHEALEKARAGRTCLIIAHRLNTVQNADQIAVFDRGQVVEQGDPKELLDKQGLYYEHWQIQQGNRRRLSRPLL